MITDDTLLIADRVVRGVALLDAETPGWRERIDLETLDLGNVHLCVLGQGFGHYLTGLDALGIEADEQSRDHGFTASSCTYDSAVLTSFWKEAIG